MTPTIRNRSPRTAEEEAFIRWLTSDEGAAGLLVDDLHSLAEDEHPFTATAVAAPVRLRIETLRAQFQKLANGTLQKPAPTPAPAEEIIRCLDLFRDQLRNLQRDAAYQAEQALEKLDYGRVATAQAAAQAYEDAAYRTSKLIDACRRDSPEAEPKEST